MPETFGEAGSERDAEIEPGERTRKIRALNDALRQTFFGGRVMLSEGVQHLPVEIIPRALRAIQAFDGFSEESDPWQEHDFGEVEIEGHKVWFKLDYYDLDGRYASPDPSDPEVTMRVMNIFLPSEY